MILRNISAGLLCVAISGFAATGSGKLSPADQRFVTTAEQDNMMEAHVGQMAENQASGSGVKDFARKLADDHTKAYSQLQKIAEQEGDTSVPRGINVKTDHEAVSLMKLKGNQFDRTFLRDEFAGHERAIAEFRREAAHGADPQIKAWAQQTIPVLQDHLNMAKQLEQSGAKSGNKMMAKKS